MNTGGHGMTLDCFPSASFSTTWANASQVLPTEEGNTVKFTKHTAASLTLPDGKDDRFESDSALPGFGCRLQRDKRTGIITRTWGVLQRVNGIQRRKSFGDVRKIELEDARNAARQWFGLIARGIDPDAERAKNRARARATRLTVGVAMDRHLKAKQHA